MAPAGRTSLSGEDGYYLKPVPASMVFHGKIYLLMDQRTSRISEAMAIWLKSDKLATLAGQKSAGIPMLFENFTIDNEFRINIPTAQFYDKSGKNWSGTGVDPDLATDEDALSFVLKR